VSSWLAEIRSGFAQLSPAIFPYRRFVLALVIGFAGGWLFAKARLPLPWMLGAMTFCTVAALLRAPVAAPPVIRAPMSAIIGVMLGSGFSPAIIAQVPQWLGPLAGLVVFMLACGSTVVWYFRKVGGYDWVTAFFSGMPGGLVEMITYGEERGGDARVIALVHSARILMVVMTLPFIIQWSQGVSLNRTGGGVSMFDAPLVAEAWLAVCGLAGAFLGHVLKLPAKILLGAMVVSAAVHVSGLSDFKPPFEIVNAAQLVLGVVIGCRFAGTASHVVMRILALSVGSTIILLAWMTLFAVLVGHLTGFSVVTLILAYSPGGLAEMSLIAVALNVEVAFVAAFHIIRVFLTMISAPLVFGWIGRKK
jgi:membrane AbrB-like protein